MKNTSSKRKREKWKKLDSKNANGGLKSYKNARFRCSDLVPIKGKLSRCF